MAGHHRQDQRPDLQIAGFSLWVDGRQFPDATDFWDANWLVVEARVEASGATVTAHGPFVLTMEIDRFYGSLKTMDQTLSGTARLDCMEPTLDITLTCSPLGQVSAEIALTPDHMTQLHKFTFDFDQTFLRPVLQDCLSILERFPIKGHRDRS